MSFDPLWVLDVAVRRGLLSPSQADADFTEVIRIQPQDADAHYNRAMVRWFRKDVDGAIADYTAAVGTDPTMFRAYYNRGLAYWEKGNFPAVVADMILTLEQAPADWDHRRRSGTPRAQRSESDRTPKIGPSSAGRKYVDPPFRPAYESEEIRCLIWVQGKGNL